MKIKLKVILFCLISSSLISCDQVTKDMAKKHLMYQQPISYFHDIFRLQYAENTGAALSLGDNLPQPYSFILLSLIPLMVLIRFTVYTFLKMRHFNTFKISVFALILAGGMGNIIDRIFNDRHVTDFMNVRINHIRTGIFNVADVCITAGVIGLLFILKKNDLSTGSQKCCYLKTNTLICQ